MRKLSSYTFPNNVTKDEIMYDDGNREKKKLFINTHCMPWKAAAAAMLLMLNKGCLNVFMINFNSLCISFSIYTPYVQRLINENNV